jgi:replicative DNA helicase
MNVENLSDSELDHILDCDDQVIYLREMTFKKGGDRFSTGFQSFDDALDGGVKEGDLIIVSGRSGAGKTTWAQTMTYHFCKNGIPCLWFSYEVSLSEVDKKFRAMGIEQFYEVAVPEKNTSGKIEWIIEKIKEGWAKYATKIVFIDHIDFLVPKDCRTSDNEQATLKRIATELKQLALELNITIITMAHVKKVDSSKDLDLYDIGYSAGIFQLADLVFMVDREKIFGKKRFGQTMNEGDTFTNNTIVKICKNRQTGIMRYLRLTYANGKLSELSNRIDDIAEASSWTNK